MTTKIRKIVVIAGEASGDQQAAALVRSMRKQDAGLEFIGIGGDCLQAEGVQLIEHVNRMALVGISEVVRHLPFLRRVMQRVRRLLRDEHPDLVILVDYPGFNLKVGARAKKLKIPVYWYISPQVWAWGQGRIPKIAAVSDAMGVILPFEKDIYADTNLPVEYVGHPLLDQVEPSLTRAEWRQSMGLSNDATILGLLPGSRVQEVERLLPTMVQAASDLQQSHPNLQVLLGRAPVLDTRIFQDALRHAPGIRMVEHREFNLTAHADLLIAASGTVTLEAGILHTPMIIVYQASRFTCWLGRRLVKSPWLGLVNILAGRSIVPELLCRDFTRHAVVEKAEELLTSEEKRRHMIEELTKVHQLLGAPGAAQRAAADVLKLLNAHTS